MATSPAFETTADLLVAATQMEALAARGTIRLALKEAGLDPASVNASQMRVVLQSVVAEQLGRRGVDDASRLCAQIGTQLSATYPASSTDNADRAAAIFERLGAR